MANVASAKGEARYAAHSPPRISGSARPSALILSPAIWAEPIMQSTCVGLPLPPARGNLSLAICLMVVEIRPGAVWPRAYPTQPAGRAW